MIHRIKALHSSLLETASFSPFYRAVLLEVFEVCQVFLAQVMLHFCPLKEITLQVCQKILHLPQSLLLA